MIGVLMNEWFLAWLLNRGATFGLGTRVGIWAVEIGLVVAGCLLLLFRARVLLRSIFANILGVAVLFMAVELLIISCLRLRIPLPSGRPLEILRNLYADRMSTVQFSAECARHDRRLGYTLRPGTCTFENAEFSTKLHVNSVGLRDDEASLQQPEIIVLGDSQAMGWGVEQRETFAEVVEARTGLIVLNAAVSSYGTARGTMIMERLDTSNVRLLIIQYSSNDYSENVSYLDGEGTLSAMSIEEYSGLVSKYGRHRPYRFGSLMPVLTRKRLVDPALNALAARLFPAHSAAAFSAEDGRAGEEQAAAVFLDVVARAELGSLSVPLVVFEIHGYGRGDSSFVDALRVEAESQSLLQIELLDLSAVLTRDHFFRLDEHLNAQGHEAVAQAILDQVRLLSPR